ncbi:hypothetical protein RAS1_05330 [Phycisphaerae bacterium RAS1]|nr:hypothetical protein RAS1_05330 [Phycisphaerae bacterium RAS1]
MRPSPLKLARPIRATRRWSFACAALLLLAGCPELRYINTQATLEPHVRANQGGPWEEQSKDVVFYPARDILTLDPLWRLLCGDEAWNAAGDGVSDSIFFTNRPAADLTPTRIAAGACVDPPPAPPFSIELVKTSGATAGFRGRDATGRRYQFKLDDAAYAEMGTAAEVISSRLLWALGYNVPPIYLVRIDGTGDVRFDGRRATASPLLDGVLGHFQFDWFRYRREVRGLRLACAWLNDVDRVGNNTLVVAPHPPAKYYLVDFNSTLGAWQGRPKQRWHGWRPAADAGVIVTVLTLGLVRAEPNPPPPVFSAAVGRFSAADFDPLRWRPATPNTAFDHLTPSDARWMARKIAALRREQVAAAVRAGGYSHASDETWVTDTLVARQARIAELAR